MSIPQKAASGGDLLTRLRELIAAGRAGAARPLLNAVLRLTPPDADTAELEARLLLLEGNAAGACGVLDAAMARAPAALTLRLARVVAREQAGDLDGAARDAAEAVVLRPDLAQPKAMLGAFLTRLGRPADGRACLAEAVAMAPEEPRYRLHLAAAESACGDAVAALATLEHGLALAPRDIELRVAAILTRLRAGDCAGAEALALAAARAGVADARVLGLLGHARSSLGRHAEAAAAYAEARKLAPEDAYVGHLAAAGGLAPDAGRAHAEYLRIVFDGYAPRFESHLIALGYRIPGLIRAELTALPEGTGPVLDLGCGTGLLAVAVGSTLGPWVGVDISPRMLAEADKHALYAELREADIAAFLAEDTRRFPVILAGDVLPYFGDLAPLLRLVAARLAPGGRFLFSVERLPEGETGWSLGGLGRYAHAAVYLRAAAAEAGLTVALLRDEVLRQEADQPVDGFLVALERPSA